MYQFGKREEVRVPTTVLIDREKLVMLLGYGDKFVGLFRGGSKRFLDDD